MNTIPKKAVIKKNKLQPSDSRPYTNLLKNKYFHIAIFFIALLLNLVIIYLLKNTYFTDDPADLETKCHLTAIFSGMFLGGFILGIKKGTIGVSLGVFLGATLAMWLSFLTEGNIISWIYRLNS
ncbi:Conserved hypothetical protein [Candidatus Phytoplasma australiense]|uniref:Uncharacterized protein n=2 Tax=Phytoplasma australiense TaxID=59748 RepID=B1VA94_PHYAS|nr:hypothetical protein [Candidatus Phytoplasma australiense]AGL90248.1 hypothetical protein SLY_0326 [Strawberry lethal yellows phytoplasma (CPA) str. NZSb11]CAM11867.1 Conserved hypothetical protein [Candidatus Phytoplasma australiense]